MNKMNFLEDKILTLLMVQLLLISIYSFNLIFKQFYLIWNLQNLHSDFIEFIKSSKDLTNCLAEPSILYDFYSNFIIQKFENESDIEAKNQIEIQKTKIKWQDHLNYNIDLLSYFETLAPFSGWLTTFYYLITTDARTKNAVWPLTLMIALSYSIKLFKQYCVNQCCEFFNELDIFSMHAIEKLKQINSNVNVQGAIKRIKNN